MTNLVKNIGQSLSGDFGGILIGCEGARWVGGCSSGMQHSVFSVTYPTAGIVKAQRKDSEKGKRMPEGKDVNDSYRISLLV